MFVDKKTKDARISVCKKCDFYRNFFMLKRPKWTKGASCGKCSCFLDAMANLTKEWFGVCPLDKWDK